MKFSQLIEYDKRNIFIEKSCRKWGKETSFRLLVVFWKSIILGKSKWSARQFHYILVALKLACNKNKPFKTLHYSSRDMLNFDFLDEGLGIVSPPHFMCDFSPKMYTQCYILLSNQISLSGCLYFLRYWTICLLQLFVNQVVTGTNFEINLSF